MFLERKVFLLWCFIKRCFIVLIRGGRENWNDTRLGEGQNKRVRGRYATVVPRLGRGENRESRGKEREKRGKSSLNARSLRSSSVYLSSVAHSRKKKKKKEEEEEEKKSQAANERRHCFFFGRTRVRLSRWRWPHHPLPRSPPPPPAFSFFPPSRNRCRLRSLYAFLSPLALHVTIIRLSLRR